MRLGAGYPSGRPRHPAHPAGSSRSSHPADPRRLLGRKGWERCGRRGGQSCGEPSPEAPSDTGPAAEAGAPLTASSRLLHPQRLFPSRLDTRPPQRSLLRPSSGVRCAPECPAPLPAHRRPRGCIFPSARPTWGPLPSLTRVRVCRHGPLCPVLRLCSVAPRER